MALGVRRLFACDLAIALTGVAGPLPQEGQPVGTVFGAVAHRDDLHVRAWHFPVDEPDTVRCHAVVAAADLACLALGAPSSARSWSSRYELTGATLVEAAHELREIAATLVPRTGLGWGA